MARSSGYVRLTEDLCQQCWMENNPDEYFPMVERQGTCNKCGAEETVCRSYVLDPQPEPTGLPVSRCESGWTGDRCTLRYGHGGPHSNE